MQILGKRSKVLLIAVAIAMLVAVGVSFAAWDSMSAVKAAIGNSSTYANAKVGDIIEFGQYYQTGNKVSAAANAEYEKTPIEWIVVDKDERTGQLTLMSKYILAAGSYFGNWYYNSNDITVDGGYYYQIDKLELDNNPYNQAYVESTARAFLNNTERRDLGGDSYSSGEFKTSAKASSKSTGILLSSIGYSNRKYRISNAEYQRPITNPEFRERPATRGFYDEAFSDNEKAMIIPKVIAGYTGFRWPNQTHDLYEKTYVEGAVDKVWMPSATELNIMGAEDCYANPSDEASSTVFEYFKNYMQYNNPYSNANNTTLSTALAAKRTDFVVNNTMAMNYSIPLCKYQSTAINTNKDISTTRNSIDYYWTRSAASHFYDRVCYVNNNGIIYNYHTYYAYFGVRPCVILKY